MTTPLSPQSRLDILALIHQADRAATNRDVTAYLAMFEPDAVIAGAPGEHDGSTLAEALKNTWSLESPVRIHLTINAEILIVATEAGRVVVTARSVLMIAGLGPRPIIELITTISHQLRATADGWKFSRRSIDTL